MICFRLKLRFAGVACVSFACCTCSPRLTKNDLPAAQSFHSSSVASIAKQSYKTGKCCRRCLTAGNNSGIPPTLLLPRPVMMTLHQELAFFDISPKFIQAQTLHPDQTMSRTKIMFLRKLQECSALTTSRVNAGHQGYYPRLSRLPTAASATAAEQ